MLPAEFADLEKFAPEWALPNEKLRQKKRVESELDAVRGFYDAVKPRMPAVFAYLDRIPHGDVAALPDDVRRLYFLGCAYIESSHPVEMHWRRTDIDDAFPLDRLVFLSPSDQR